MRVDVHGLSKAFRYLWALKDLTLELHAGDCVAVLGPNGAGKSTLLKLLAGLLAPTSGAIEIDGQRLGIEASPLRRSIGFLSPHDYLYENLTAKENLGFFSSLYGRRKSPAELREALDAVGLLRWADDYVASLSSGMRCRLGLAKWLLLEPRLLLADEPYGVLDASGVNLLEDYLKRLCQTGAIAVLATHQVARVPGLCSRALILSHGKLLFDEPRREPWTNLHHALEGLVPRAERWRS